MSVELHHGDCLEVLRAMPDNSVDSVVTDPPYNLSDSGKRDKDCLTRILAEVQLPDTDERDSLLGEGVDLPTPRGKVAPLDGEDRTIPVDAQIGMPESAVDLKGSPVSQEKVKHADEAAEGSTDANLPFVADAETVEDLGDFILEPAGLGNPTFCDGTCGCFTEPSAGVIAMAVRAIPAAGLPDSGVVLGRERRRDSDVSLGNDAASQPEGPASVVADAGAVDAFMLRLDLSGRAGELHAAHGALALHGSPKLRPSEFVGTGAGASGLPPMLEPYRVRVVGDGADRTLTLHLPISLRHAAKSTRTGGFMGKTWDGWESPASFQRWCKEWATECLRVLKPGGHLLAFGGTRTSHRLACAIEDAGFEIRDSIGYMHQKPISGQDAADVLEAWREWTQRVPHAGVRFSDAIDNSAHAPVLLSTSLARSPADALIAELASNEAPPTTEGNWRSVLSDAAATTTGSNALVNIAESLSANPVPTSTTTSTAPSDALEWLSESIALRIKAAAALRIWRGSKPSTRRAATDALCAALTDDLKLITCAQSKTFQSYDMTSQTVSVSATTVTTTAYTAALLISSMAATLASRGGDATEADSSGPLAWIYGSGFPPAKSLDVSKAIDKRRDWALVERLAGEIKRARAESGMSLAEIGQATLRATNGTYGKWYHRGGHMFFETGRNLPSRPEWDQLRHVLPIAAEFADVYDEAEREVIAARPVTDRRGDGTVVGLGHTGNADITAPATDAARTWQGWGTALKPAHEPIVVARKPLAGTVAANVLQHGTGALNVDGCRVESGVRPLIIKTGDKSPGSSFDTAHSRQDPNGTTAGRWPANVVLDESQAAALDEQSGERASGSRKAGTYGLMGYMGAHAAEMPAISGDKGGASRFFYVAGSDPTDQLDARFRYVAKAPKSERPVVDGVSHPTVKPLELFRWLVRLVTPPGGVVLEPFAGSGTTVEAALLEGFRVVAIEREADYLPLIEARIARVAARAAQVEPDLFTDDEGDAA